MTTPFFESKTARTTTRNPFEAALGMGAGVAIIIGLAVFAMATAAYDRGASATEFANTLSGAAFSLPDSAPLVWAGLGTQLWQLGLVVLVGMSFYWMVQWDRTRVNELGR